MYWAAIVASIRHSPLHTGPCDLQPLACTQFNIHMQFHLSSRLLLHFVTPISERCPLAHTHTSFRWLPPSTIVRPFNQPYLIFFYAAHIVVFISSLYFAGSSRSVTLLLVFVHPSNGVRCVYKCPVFYSPSAHSFIICTQNCRSSFMRSLSLSFALINGILNWECCW